MDFIHGITIDRIEELKKMGADLGAVTTTLGKAYIKQIFIDGFFHADPHQANIFVIKGNRVCFLDFGAIGYLDAETRDLVGSFYIALISQNVGKAAQALIELSGKSERDVNLQRLEWDLRDLLDYNLLQKADVPVDTGMNQRIVDIAMKHKVMLPSSFVLLERALMQIDGVCRQLNPDFDIVDIARKNLLPVLRQRYDMKPDPLDALETAREYKKLMSTLPKRADTVLSKLENDDLTVKIDTGLVDDLKNQIRKTGLIVAISIIVATLIVNITLTGQSIKLSQLPITITIMSILILWVFAVILVHRRL
ncbi:MAG: AarF/ABC1/UbiB kinase family protein [Thermoplasmata archaeon]|nr:MAG: AarF/ABC1/UbiB kinase family protein [Thermoplasmata archaeon]